MKRRETTTIFTLSPRINVENPKRTWCAILPPTLLKLPTCAFVLDQKLATESR